MPLSQLDSGAYIVQLAEDSSLYALFIGTVLTAMIHSSSARVGILMSFIDQGVVGLTEAMSVVLGSNIGNMHYSVMASFKRRGPSQANGLMPMFCLMSSV